MKKTDFTWDRAEYLKDAAAAAAAAAAQSKAAQECLVHLNSLSTDDRGAYQRDLEAEYSHEFELRKTAKGLYHEASELYETVARNLPEKTENDD